MTTLVKVRISPTAINIEMSINISMEKRIISRSSAYII